MLDLKSITICLLTILAVINYIFIKLCLKCRLKGIKKISIFFITSFLSFFLLIFRTESRLNSLFTILIANLIILVGFIFLLKGLEELIMGRSRVNIINYVILIIFSFIQSYYTFLNSNITARQVVVSLFSIIFLVEILFTLFKERKNIIIDLSDITTAVILSIIISTLRIIFAIFIPQGNSLYTSNLPVSIVFLLYIAASLLISFSLLKLIYSQGECIV